jgi:hypothetical protein
MFLKRIPNDSKIVLSMVCLSLTSGIVLGVKKLVYDADIIIKKK